MKNNFIGINGIVLTTVMVTPLIPVSGFAEAGAKSLFIRIDDKDLSPASNSKPVVRNPKKTTRKKRHQFNANAPATKVEYSGLQYWIDLQEDNGRSRRVTTSHTFRSGDRIKLQVKSRSSGFLYVINQDASGQQTSLYPAKGQEPKLIQPGVIYTIPAHGTIRFDNTPGNEKITVALAKYPITQPGSGSASKESEANFAGQTMYAACSDSTPGTKRLFIDESNGLTDCIRKNYSAGAKGMYSEEDAVSPEPASYSVFPASLLNEGKVMFVDFNLVHR